MMNAFYHHIQKLCVQCQFNDDEEHLVDAIIFGTKVQKAREKLLQMPKHLTLCDCLKICHHYESLQYHLNVVKPTDKQVESITKCHFNRGGKQPSAKKTGTFRGQPSTKPVNSADNIVQCSNFGMTHPKDRCLAYRSTCFKCNILGHYLSECRSNSSSNSTQNTRQFTRFHGRGRTSSHGRGFTPRRQVHEATEIPEAKSNDKSHLDIVRLMEAYGLSNNSPQTSLKQRVQVDDIKVIDIGFENIVNITTREFTMPVPVLHGAPTEYDVCTEWDAVEELEPISSYIGQQCM